MSTSSTKNIGHLIFASSILRLGIWCALVQLRRKLLVCVCVCGCHRAAYRAVQAAAHNKLNKESISWSHAKLLPMSNRQIRPKSGRSHQVTQMRKMSVENTTASRATNVRHGLANEMETLGENKWEWMNWARMRVRARARPHTRGRRIRVRSILLFTLIFNFCEDDILIFASFVLCAPDFSLAPLSCRAISVFCAVWHRKIVWRNEPSSKTGGIKRYQPIIWGI